MANVVNELPAWQTLQKIAWLIQVTEFNSNSIQFETASLSSLRAELQSAATTIVGITRPFTKKVQNHTSFFIPKI